MQAGITEMISTREGTFFCTVPPQCMYKNMALAYTYQGGGCAVAFGCEL